MAQIHDILRIARKELFALSRAPFAYIIAVLFVGVSQFLFFAATSLVPEASIAGFVYFLPWLFILLVPALTMGLIAAEQDNGTYELLATRPITDAALVIGKYLGVLVYVAVLLTLTLAPVAVSLSFFGDLDVGTTIAGFLAGLAMGSVLASVGLAISAYTGKQIAALLSSVAAAFLLVLLGYELVTQLVPPSIAHLLERVSVLSHYTNVARGVLDTGDLWYFVSFTVAALSLAHYRLLSLRVPRLHKTRATWRIVTVLIIVTAAVSNLLGSSLPGRIDLTAQGRYTLSGATKDTLAELSDVVLVTLYVSSDLPSQHRPIERDTRDLLRDYVRYGNGNVTLTIKDPSSSPEEAREAEQAGVYPVQFNMVGDGELSVEKAYHGITIAYGGDSRSVPFVQDTSNLEYDVTRAIVDLTRTEKKKVRFVSGAGGLMGSAPFSTLYAELAAGFDVDTFELSSSTFSIPSDVRVLVLGTPVAPFDAQELARIRSYFEGGGAVLAFLSGVELEEQSLLTTETDTAARSLFSSYGVTVEPDMVYDPQAGQVIQMRAENGATYLLEYPWWLRARTHQTHPIARDVEQVFMPWTSSLALSFDVASTADVTLTPIITSSPYAGSARGTFDLQPGQPVPPAAGQEHVLGVLLAKQAGTSSARAVLIGSQRMVMDDTLSNSPENLALALSAVSYLAEEDSIASIKAKTSGRSPLTLPSASVWSVLMYGNLAFGVALPTLVGLYVFIRRRRMATKMYVAHQ